MRPAGQETCPIPGQRGCNPAPETEWALLGPCVHGNCDLGNRRKPACVANGRRRIRTMFCSGCGQAMQAFEQVCPRCGRPVPPMPVARPPMYSRVQRHLHTLGVLWIAWAAWNVVGWLIAMPFLTGVFGGWGWGGPHGNGFHGFGPGFPFMHMMWLPWVISVVVFGRSILAVITGIALLLRAPWGRTLAIVTA